MKRVIRKATREDAARLAEIKIASWRKAYAGIVPEFYLANLDKQEFTADYLEIITLAEESIDILICQGEIIGFITTGPAQESDCLETTAEIKGQYLLPEYWSQGLGRELFFHGLDVVKAQGFKRAILYVLQKNTRSRKFYESAGFVFLGHRKIYNLGRELTALRYGKEFEVITPGLGR